MTERRFNTLIGRRIREARLTLGWSQDALARKVKLSRVSITNIEAGRQGNITLILLDRIAGAFGMKIGHLMRDVLGKGTKP